MKMNVSAGILLATLMWCSCEPTVSFTEAQPPGVRSQTSFPRRIQGAYLSSDGADTLYIFATAMVGHYAYTLSEHKDSLKGYIFLPGDTLLSISDSSLKKVQVVNDSVIWRSEGTDTMFLISETNQLKKYKGYYFLNKKIEDRKWEVIKLSLKNERLVLSTIHSPDEIKALQEITETDDSTVTNFELTRRQFRHFVRKRGFSESDSFLRIRKMP